MLTYFGEQLVLLPIPNMVSPFKTTNNLNYTSQFLRRSKHSIIFIKEKFIKIKQLNLHKEIIAV